MTSDAAGSAPIDTELLRRLRDPQDQAELRLGTAAEVESARALLSDRDGYQAIDGLLVSTANATRAYPIVGGIPYLLAEEAIELSS